MTFKVIRQDSSWIFNSNIDIQYQEHLSEIEIPKTTFILNSKNPPNDFLEYGSLVLVSDNIVNVLRNYKDIEVILSDITIIWNGEKYTKHDFYIMQVIDELECINYEESKYKCFASAPTEIMSLYKLVTYPVNTDIHKLFVINNTGFLGIANYISNELISHGCTGIRLIEISDVTI